MIITLIYISFLQCIFLHGVFLSLISSCFRCSYRTAVCSAVWWLCFSLGICCLVQCSLKARAACFIRRSVCEGQGGGSFGAAAFFLSSMWFIVCRVDFNCTHDFYFHVAERDTWRLFILCFLKNPLEGRGISPSCTVSPAVSTVPGSTGTQEIEGFLKGGRKEFSQQPNKVFKVAFSTG